MQSQQRGSYWSYLSTAVGAGVLALAASGCQPSPSYHQGGHSYHPQPAPAHAPQPSYHPPTNPTPQSQGTVLTPGEAAPAPASPSAGPAGEAYSTSPPMPGG